MQSIMTRRKSLPHAGFHIWDILGAGIVLFVSICWWDPTEVGKYELPFSPRAAVTERVGSCAVSDVRLDWAGQKRTQIVPVRPESLPLR